MALGCNVQLSQHEISALWHLFVSKWCSGGETFHVELGFTGGVHLSKWLVRARALTTSPMNSALPMFCISSCFGKAGMSHIEIRVLVNADHASNLIS